MPDPLPQQRLDKLWDFDDVALSEQRLREAMTAETDPVVRAELETQVARALGLRDAFVEADALLDSIPDPQGALAVRVLLERGRLRTSSDQLIEAIPLFEEALLLAAAQELDYLAVDAAHMLVIANPTRAEHWTTRALETVDETTDARARRWGISLHNNLGWTFFDSGRLAEALAQFELAADAADAYGTADQQRLAQQAIDEARRELRAI